MAKSRQLDAWTGAFGRAYLERNAAIDAADIGARRKALAPVLAACPEPPRSILEVGSNVGKNLIALAGLTDAALHAVEPFEDAYARLVGNKDLDLAGAAQCGGEALPHADGAIDMVFTSGVLIHVAPDMLGRVMGEIVRVARRYVWCNEYFAKTPEAIPYRGEADLLFKRDFGRLYLETFPALRPLATGFLWSADTPYDDTTWWLFEKSPR